MFKDKKIFAIILFSFSSILCFSQNWQLLNPAYKYNFYTTNQSIVAATVWVDSIKNNTSYLNRIVTPCDTCISAHLANDFYDTAYVLSNQPTFLQRKLLILPNGSYNLIDKGNVMIHTTDTLNSTWIFDSINNINAQLIAK
ncbi:MAG: hypothetical protein ABI388_02750, partial [Bacteroidia bacterium]